MRGGSAEDPAPPAVRIDKGKGSSCGRKAGFHIIQSLPELLPGASPAAFGGSVIFCCPTTCNRADILPKKLNIVLAVTDRGTAFQGSKGGRNYTDPRDIVTAAAGGGK